MIDVPVGERSGAFVEYFFDQFVVKATRLSWRRRRDAGGKKDKEKLKTVHDSDGSKPHR